MWMSRRQKPLSPADVTMEVADEQTNKEICLWKDTRWFVQRTSQTYFEGVKIFLFEILFLLNKNTCKLIYVTQTTKQNIFQIF